MSPNIFKDASAAASTYLDYNKVNSGRTSLRNTIAGWYYALRNLAMVALLSILVYVSIRMILSSVSQDKAKYKTMFKDWLVALCLLFALHYIMVAILNITDEITKAIGDGGYTVTSGLASEIESAIDEATEVTRAFGTTEDGDEHVLELMKEAMSNTVIYLAVVIMNIIFVVKYVIRALTIIFLILLAPITCITYPIDKISDGKAQAYDTWFKEFLYQVIIQPFHILLYIVLIGSSAELASKNLIYAMLCFGVMIPAEKFIKQMFGFKDKLGSPLGSFASGALASQLMSKIFSGGGSKVGGKDKGNGEGDSSSTENELPPRTVDNDALMDGEPGALPPGDSGRNNLPVEDPNRNPEGNDPNPGGDNISGEDDQTLDAEDGELLEEDEYLPEETQDDEWHPDLTDEQIDELKAEGIRPGDNEYGMYLANHGLKPQPKQSEIEHPQVEPEEENGKFRKEEEYTDVEDDEPQNNQPQPQNNQPQPQNNRPQQLSNQPQNRTRRDVARDNLRQASAIHNQRMTKKWGSADRGQRWKNRGKKLAKTVGRAASSTVKTGVRGAAVVGGALALGAFGAMFGQGEKGLAAGAAAGAYLSKKTISGATSVYNKASNAAKDYYNGLKSDEKREAAAKNKFTADNKQIDKAVYSYRKNHDGADPNRKQLQQEVDDRYELSRYGLSDDQIDDSLKLYQSKNQEVLEREATNKGIDTDALKEEAGGKDNLDQAKYRQLLEKNLKKTKDGEQSIAKAKSVAASQTKYTSQLAKAYSAKDFRDPKAMENAYNAITAGLMEGREDTEANRQLADSYARKYLSDAGEMHGVSNVPLPTSNNAPEVQEHDTTAEVQAPRQRVAIPVQEPDIMDTLQLNGGGITQEQQQHVENLHLRVREAGYDVEQVHQMAGSVAERSSTPEETIRNFETVVNASVEYVENREARSEAEKTVRSLNDGKAPKVAVNSEVRERFVLKSTFNIEKEKDVSAIRDMETENFESKTQIEMSREYAKKTRGMSEAGKARERKQLREKLKTSGDSMDKIEKDLDNIVDLAEVMNDPNKAQAQRAGATRSRRATTTTRTQRVYQSGNIQETNVDPIQPGPTENKGRTQRPSTL